ncbi:MAG: insulinase family protein [Acidobacteria bacterium]|nr:MAG: insulinase family protein [Acidobacteriota bacterium]REK02097.1 MAG: insulinase family protein [Acidobacteriota bacterium]REK15055.1 MAG: insulinase family protein [Acidobacteriota bacterium]REK45769.1 MAG: insulinase family protein [Acidobacteriota bacterium]
MKDFSKAGMSFAMILALLLAPFMPTAVYAQSGASATPKIEFEKYTLPNGLEVILHVDRKLPIVHVNQWFHVGSANEVDGRTGFAHLFEHMMFQGSKNASRDYLKYVEAAGANLLEGGVNGTTSNDRTNYFATVPSGNLENLLWVESDRLATLPEALTKENLDNQRDVVKNERRQGLENQPYGRWFKIMGETAYSEGHPYWHPVIGSHEDLTAASEDDVREFFRTYYTPNNLSLVIAGDFDVEATKRMIEKYFGTIPAGPPLERPAKGMPKLDGERFVKVNDRVPLARTYLGWHMPGYFQPGEAELTLVATILTDGLSARLNKALVYDKQLAANVNSFTFGRNLTGSFVLFATARPDADLGEIEKIIFEEISRLGKEGPTQEELDRAKTKWEFNFIAGLERIGGFGGKADLLNQYNTFLGDPGKFEEDLARHRKVTVDGVKDAVSKYLDTENRVRMHFVPERSGRPSDVAIDRTQEPPLGGDRPFNAPEVETAKLENGMDVFVVSKPELPKVAVALSTRAGAVADPAGKAGTAALANRVMRRGTDSLSALEIDEKLGNLGTSIGGGAGRESGGLSMEVLTRNLDSALEVMADIAINPSFPDEEFDREKKQTLDNLAQAASNPNSVANRVAYMLAFGKDHPYGRPTGGLPGTVQKITKADLVAFHDRYWKPGSSALVFVGNLSLQEAVAKAREHFGSWSGGSAPAVNIPAANSDAAGKVYLIDRQGAAQTVVNHILPGPPRKSDDYYALSLANTVYGGGFGTRLNLNLREDKGYSYGVFAFPNFMSRDGIWLASGGVQTDKTKESAVEFVKELKYIAGEKPISNEELETARKTRVRGYAQQFESYGRIAGQILSLWLEGLPMTELQQEPEELNKLQLGAVNAVAQKYAKPDGTALLLVGDLSKIEQGIRELNLGEIIILDVEGNPVAK